MYPSEPHLDAAPKLMPPWDGNSSLKHCVDLAEQGSQKTPAEVSDWFSDADELLQAFGLDVPPEELVDVIEGLKGKLPPLRTECGQTKTVTLLKPDEARRHGSP